VRRARRAAGICSVNLSPPERVCYSVLSGQDTAERAICQAYLSSRQGCCIVIVSEAKQSPLDSIGDCFAAQSCGSQ
jgi:hypothetical protein